MSSQETQRAPGAFQINMDHQWLPFTANRHFKQDPRVFVAADGMHVGVLAAGVLWTLGVTLYLLWHFLSRRDEERLLAALRVAYPDAVGSRGRARSGR